MKIFILRNFKSLPLALITLTLLLVVIAAFMVYPTLTESKELDAKTLLSGKIIAIDPGHGGADPGAIGVNGSLEKDINLQLSLALQKYLEKKGAQVLLTRKDDRSYSDIKKEDLDARAEKVHRAKADIFISMQCNATTDSSCRGAQVFYFLDSKKGEQLAKEIQSQLWQQTEQEKKREAQTISSPYILQALEIPAIIVEAGFISNPEEEAMLLDEGYQKKVAKAVCQGIINYYKAKPAFFSMFQS